MDQLKKTLEQIRAIWEKMGATARFGALGAVLAVLVGVLVASLMMRPSYRVLYSGLEPKDAAEVVAALDSAKITHRLAGGGTIIEVDDDDVDRARLLLAEQGLPNGGEVGLQELFDEPKFGRTRFDQKVMYVRGMQGELERTISNLDAVSSARIHLSLPDKAVFEDEKLPATAAVTLKLVRGRTIAEGSVGAIQHLVAAAVEGLEAGNVTVVDTEGVLLSRTGTDPRAAASLDFKHDMERQIVRKVTQLLERTVGPGGVQVSVAADVDFSQTETTEEIFDPEQTAIRSEATQEAYEGSKDGQPQGLAGAPANAPGAATATTARNGQTASRVVQSKNYEVNRTVVHTLGPTAQLKRISVSVLVDGSWTSPEGGGDAVYAPRSPEEIAELQQVVENAVGYNAARGDRIKVASVPFVDRSRLDESAFAAEEGMPDWIWAAGAGGAALLLALVAWFVLRRGARKPSAVTPEVLAYPTSVSEAQRALEALGQAQESLPPASEGDAENGKAALNAPEKLRQQVIEASDDDPERTAEIIRAWMSEEAA